MHNGIRFKWNFQRQLSGRGNWEKRRVVETKGGYRKASRQKSRKGGKSGENDGGGLCEIIFRIHWNPRRMWERTAGEKKQGEYERDSSRRRVDGSRGDFPLAFLKTRLKTGHRERGIVTREAWLEIRRADEGGWDGRKATREEAHAYAVCMPRGNNSYDSSGGTANRRCKITALRAMHETEFYGTFCSIPNTSPKLVMENRLPSFSPRFTGDRTSFEIFASSGNVILLSLVIDKY